MEKTQHEALQRALILLKAAGVEYAIRTNDGQTYGTLPIGEPVKVRTRVRSGISKEYRAAQNVLLELMQPGDCNRFSAGEYRLESVRSAITGWCNHKWGKQSYISTIHRETNEVEILRVE